MDSTFRWQILYRYDGTNPATPVGDPLIGLTNVTHLFATPDFLYFSGSTSEFGDELYRLDGTNTTPTRLMDFAEGSNSSYPIVKGYFNNLVYFTSNANQGALFTVNVAGEIVEFALDPIQGRHAQSMFQIGDKLYWMGPVGTGNPYTSKWALWSKTGDQPVVQEADSYTMLGMDYFPEAWEIDGKVYFISDDGEHGREIFRLGGTSLVERLNTTKNITAFKANKSVLSWNVKKSIRTFVLANPTATVAKCVGRTAVGKWSWAEKKLARDRATAVCNYATSVQSGLSKWISSGPGKQAGKAFSRVSLTLRN
jgi:ELWxxDGT repeat protein